MTDKFNLELADFQGFENEDEQNQNNIFLSGFRFFDGYLKYHETDERGHEFQPEAAKNNWKDATTRIKILNLLKKNAPSHTISKLISKKLLQPGSGMKPYNEDIEEISKQSNKLEEATVITIRYDNENKTMKDSTTRIFTNQTETSGTVSGNSKNLFGSLRSTHGSDLKESKSSFRLRDGSSSMTREKKRKQNKIVFNEEYNPKILTSNNYWSKPSKKDSEKNKKPQSEKLIIPNSSETRTLKKLKNKVKKNPIVHNQVDCDFFFEGIVQNQIKIDSEKLIKFDK